MGKKNEHEEGTTSNQKVFQRDAREEVVWRAWADRKLASCWEWEDEQYRRGSSRNQAEIDRDQIPGNGQVFAFDGRKYPYVGNRVRK